MKKSFPARAGFSLAAGSRFYSRESGKKQSVSVCARVRVLLSARASSVSVFEISSSSSRPARHGRRVIRAGSIVIRTAVGPAPWVWFSPPPARATCNEPNPLIEPPQECFYRRPSIRQDYNTRVTVDEQLWRQVNAARMPLVKRAGKYQLARLMRNRANVSYGVVYARPFAARRYWRKERARESIIIHGAIGNFNFAESDLEELGTVTRRNWCIYFSLR